uniref:Inactive dipeptidyl peptidase 10 n=1 Tax=Cacopsylla melanoneura TaxID=428564 RepID=A0A8D8RBP9_9HEMI
MQVAIERNSWKLPPEDILQVADPKSKEEQEDLGYSGDSQNWRSVILALLVIGIVISGIVTAINLIGYVDELLEFDGRRMHLDEFLRGEMVPEKLVPSWVTASQLVFQGDDGNLYVLNGGNDTLAVLVTNHTLRQLNVEDYQCSTDLKYILLKHNSKQVFQNTRSALYTVYDVTNDHHLPITLSDSSQIQQTKLDYATWAANTSVLIFIANNDIYVRYSPLSGQDIRITNTGQPDIYYNGVPDWLYQEEIFQPESNIALWPSPDGSYILFASFNDSEVRSFSYPWIEPSTMSSASTSQSFPSTKSIRYPTPGTALPKVSLWIVSIKEEHNHLPHVEIQPPVVLRDQDYYLTSAQWLTEDNSQISAIWMNRAQNISIISNCQASTQWICNETHAERAMDNMWLDVQPHPVFSPDGQSYMLISPVQEGPNIYTHIKHVTLVQQKIAVISHGPYYVIKILAWDTVNHLVYYMGTHESWPGQQHLYVIKDPTADDTLRHNPKCITCDLSEPYKNCSYFNVYMNKISEQGHTQYVVSCDGPQLPLAFLHRTSDNSPVRLLFNTSTKYAEMLDKVALPKRQSMEVMHSQGHKAHVQFTLPPSWRPELRDATFPVVIHVNGRPGGQLVSDKFAIDWATYMSNKHDIIYVKIDVRGARTNPTTALYRRIGAIEVQDHMETIQHLLDQYKYLDRNKITIWGWGYGGYVTTRLLGSQPHQGSFIFRCGVSVAPVTDFNFYNAAFTERILGFPNDNQKGYVEAGASQRVDHIPAQSLFLIHGLADISVPYIHTLSIAQALAERRIIFRYQSYANEGHPLSGVLSHVYSSVEDYLIKCLKLEEEDSSLTF